MTTLVICEKPSVAKDIFATLENGKGVKMEGYYHIKMDNDIFVTYAFGHLLKIENNLSSKWEENPLPIFPEKFNYAATDKRGNEQLGIIRRLAEKADELVVATDAGREGELIARLILNHVTPGWEKRLRSFRFFTSEALTSEVISRCFKKLDPLTKYNYLYYSGIARQHADWLIGINFTRFYTLNNTAKALISVGRVQTPVVSLINDRCVEIRNFTAATTYQLGFEHELEGGRKAIFLANLTAQKEGEISDKCRVITERHLPIVKIEEGKEKRVKCPTLHSLTTLQQEANTKFGLTAQQTLDIAQKLYEDRKVLTYPRTDSQYLAASSRDFFKTILTTLGYADYAARVDGLGEELFNDKKLTDHHALLVTKDAVDGMSKEELQVYGLVRARMLNFFLGDYTFIPVAVIGENGGYEFIFRYSRIVSFGWKQGVSTDEEEDEPLAIAFEKGNIAGRYLPVKHTTKPPKYFTEAALLKKMEELGLGTPATRAAIIEKIIERGYVSRDGKKMVASRKGEEMVNHLIGSRIVSPEMTAAWEAKLEAVTDFNSCRSFLSEIREFVTSEMNDRSAPITIARGISAKQEEYLQKLAKSAGKKVNMAEVTTENFDTYLARFKEEGQITCKCGGAVKEGPKAFFCPKCEVTVYKEMYRKKISHAQAAKLFAGEKVAVKGFKKMDGTATFDASILVKDKKVVFDK